MRYFTKELLSKINSSIYEDELNADIEWEKNMNEYWDRVKSRIKNRISQNAYSILENISFHDYRVLNIEIIHREFGLPNLLEILITLTDDLDIWQIKYKGVKKFKIDYESGKSSLEKKRGLGTWGYDELLDFDEKTLSHEILFQFGTTLLIHFKNNGIVYKKLKKRK